jgi:hypothetical protein
MNKQTMLSMHLRARRTRISALWTKLALFVLLAGLASGCSSLALAQPAPTPTDCGCTLEGPAKTLAAPGGELSAAGPALPGEADPTPNWPALRGQWQATDWEGLVLEIPAGYAADGPYAYCAPRPDDFPAKGARAALYLGARTILTVYPEPGELPAALAAYQAAQAEKGWQFEAPRDQTAGDAPALSAAYLAGEDTGRVIFFNHAGALYRIETAGPSRCDIPELDLAEAQAVDHLLESMAFSE